MSFSLWRPSMLALVALVLGVGLSACGDADDGAATGTTVSADPVVQRGYSLAQSRGCIGCHTLSGDRASGPTWKGLAGSEVPLTDGRTVAADPDYLRRAIVEPDAEVHRGFARGVMSAVMSGQKDLSPDEVEALVAYIQTVR